MPLNRFFLLSLGTSLLALSACASSPTQWMPKGYRYQDSTPLSSPAPSSPWLDEAVIQDTEKLAANTAAWQGSVYELVGALQQYLPNDGSPLRLEAMAPVTAHDMALDHYLRQTLMQKGYTITTTADAGTVVMYDASALTHDDTLKQAQKIAKFQYVKGSDLKGVYLLSASVKNATKVTVGTAGITAVLPHEKDTYSMLSGLSRFADRQIAGKSLTPPAKTIDRQ